MLDSITESFKIFSGIIEQQKTAEAKQAKC